MARGINDVTRNFERRKKSKFKSVFCLYHDFCFLKRMFVQLRLDSTRFFDHLKDFIGTLFLVQVNFYKTKKFFFLAK